MRLAAPKQLAAMEYQMSSVYQPSIDGKPYAADFARARRRTTTRSDLPKGWACRLWASKAAT